MSTTVHLSEGMLRALVDRELPLVTRLSCRIHVALCERCRKALEAAREDERRANELLTLLEGTVDTDSGWQRLSASQAGARQPGRLQSRAGSVWLAWAVAAVLAVVAGTLLFQRVGDRPSVAGSGVGHQDVCCWDLDGGGPSDDGVMTVSRAGELLDCVVLYDDLDRSRSFTDGDAIRYISRPESCAPPAELEAGNVYPPQLAMFGGGE